MLVSSSSESTKLVLSRSLLKIDDGASDRRDVRKCPLVVTLLLLLLLLLLLMLLLETFGEWWADDSLPRVVALQASVLLGACLWGLLLWWLSW